MKAHDILTAAQRHMQDRAATYDRPEGERSMGATVEAFRAVTGDGLMNTEERGWLFMELLKAVRSQQGDYRADNYEDGAAYFALMGEAAARDRKKPIIRELYVDADQEKAMGKVVLAGHEIDTDFDTEKTRMPQVGTNGNEGEHYVEAGDGWVAHSGGPKPVPGGTVVQYRMRDGSMGEQPAGLLRWKWAGMRRDILEYKVSNTNDNEGTHYAPTLPAGFSWADAPPDANVLVMATMTGAYHWADAFSDGARIYGANFLRLGLSRNSGWKLIARRPGSDPGWVVSAGQMPDLPSGMLVEVTYRCGARRRGYVVNSMDWADVAAYRVVEALEQ